MREQWDVLVASADVEHRRALIRLLDNLSLNVLSTSDLRQAEEVLARQSVSLVFCDDQLPDGSYRELLTTRRMGHKAPRVVVTTVTGEWKDYLEAMRLGVFDVIHAPFHPTDVELVVIRAIHDEEQRATLRMSA